MIAQFFSEYQTGAYEAGYPYGVSAAGVGTYSQAVRCLDTLMTQYSRQPDPMRPAAGAAGLPRRVQVEVDAILKWA